MAATKKYNLDDKVVLVTGSSSGIGAAIAAELAQNGAKVVITGRNAEKLSQVGEKIKELVDGAEVLEIVGDLLDDELPERLIGETIEAFGRLDILINNAGGATPKGGLDSEKLLEEYDQTMKLNVRSVLDLTQRAMPHLEATKGNIINISSVAAVRSVWLVYCASKACLDSVTKACALELAPKGIRVNSINPGPVATSFGRSLGLDEAAGEELIQSWAAGTALNRVATPEEIAHLAVFLVSDDAANMTGSIVFSDGGLLIK